MVQTSNKPVPGRPGRQRSRAVDEAILAAALEILAQDGYGEFTVNRVIERAGVSSATLYRRWASSDDLVAAALRSVQPESVAIDTGTLDADVGALVDYLGASLQSLAEIAAAEASGPRAPEQLRREVGITFAAPRKALLDDILRRARERGELAGVLPLDLAWTMVVSPLHHRLHVRGEALTPAFTAATKRFLVAGLRALATG